MDNAKTNEPIYVQLAAQLVDPMGIAFSIETSLTEVPIAIEGASLTTLTAWLSTIQSYPTGGCWRLFADGAGQNRGDRFVAAIEALTGSRAHRGSSAPRKRGKMSAAAQKRLSLAAKARWAKAKKGGEEYAVSYIH